MSSQLDLATKNQELGTSSTLTSKSTVPPAKSESSLAQRRIKAQRKVSDDENSICKLEQGEVEPIVDKVSTDSEKYDEERVDKDEASMVGTTPSRRNKRKMTEPRKRRTDFSIRSLCSNSDDEEEEDDEDGETGHHRGRSKRKRDAEENREPVISTARREDSFRTTSTTPASSPFLPAAYPYIINAAMVYQASTTTATAAATISSLLSPFSLSSTDSIPPPTSTTITTTIDHRDNDRAASRTSADMEAPLGPGVSSPSPLPFRFDGSPTVDDCPVAHGRRPRKNYKNMTKQRRIEANARERTRVHTISAAFESLRRAVPSYSYNQRLSKLAILRIACSYILALARLAELDYSQEQSGMTFGDCVDLCTQTIQTEGKAKRRH